MLLDTDFSFKNQIGKYEISTYKSIIGHNPDTHKEIIRCVANKGYKEIYQSAISGSVAMDFSNIDPNDIQAILDFSNRYGLICPYHSSENLFNDDVYKTSFLSNEQQKVFNEGLGGQFYSLWFTQRAIVNLKYCLSLMKSIESKDLVTILSIITFFAFDENINEGDNSIVAVDGSKQTTPNPHNYEIAYFNQLYRQYIKSNDMLSLSYNNKIKCFTAYYHKQIIEMKITDSKFDGKMFAEFPLLHNTSQTLLEIYSLILNNFDITNISDLGNVSFNPPLSDTEISAIITNKDSIYALAKAILSDRMNIHLTKVRPSFRCNNSHYLPNWNIESLLDAMYLEIFFDNTSSHNQIKKCANCNCNKFFLAENSRKIYCSANCAWATSKRKSRQKEEPI